MSSSFGMGPTTIPTTVAPGMAHRGRGPAGASGHHPHHRSTSSSPERLSPEVSLGSGLHFQGTGGVARASPRGMSRGFGVGDPSNGFGSRGHSNSGVGHGSTHRTDSGPGGFFGTESPRLKVLGSKGTSSGAGPAPAGGRDRGHVHHSASSAGMSPRSYKRSWRPAGK